LYLIEVVLNNHEYQTCGQRQRPNQIIKRYAVDNVKILIYKRLYLWKEENPNGTLAERGQFSKQEVMHNFENYKSLFVVM
jgi:hypothetical protein